MSAIKLEGVLKSYKGAGGDFNLVVNEIDLEVKEGTITALLGPSGCGKSTTLRMLAGIEDPTSGKITIGDQVVFSSEQGINVPPNKRSIGMVFQSYALWPHMTVFDNVAYPRRRRKQKQDLRERVMAVLESVGCGHLAERYPYQLSGGQQQRVALARALAANPDIVLFDEPLSNLDAKLRDRLKYEIKDLQEQLKFSAVYVTHDQEEALTIGHQCAIMNEGNFAQVGPPQQVYKSPVNRFVFNFLGEAKFFTGNVVESNSDWTSLSVADSTITGRTRGKFSVGETVQLGVRSESIHAVADHSRPIQTNENSLDMSVKGSYFAGHSTVVNLGLTDGTDLRLRLPHETTGATSGAIIFHPEDALVFGNSS